MKRIVAIISGLAVAGVLGSAAWGAEADEGAVEGAVKDTGRAIQRGAEATGGAIKRGAEATGHAIKRGAEATGDALGITDTERRRYEANRLGEHRVSGTVAAIDHDTGAVSLSTGTETLHLHFPPRSVRDVRTGQHMTAQLAFALPDHLTREEPAAERDVAGDQPLEGAHWMTGTITSVDKSSGVVQVRTDDLPLKLQFSPASVRDFSTGDRIAVELAQARSGS